MLFSGGLILSQSIIETLVEDDSFELFITCPRWGPYHQFIRNHSKIRVVPPWILNRLLRWMHDYFWLPLLIRRVRPDIVFTLGNLPARTHFKQIFLHDNPYLAEKSIVLIPLSLTSRLIHILRCKLTLSRMHFVDLVLVQTEYQKRGIELKLKEYLPIKLLSPYVPYPYNPIQMNTLPIPSRENKIKILCLSRYYEHKNIEILLDLASLIKCEELPYIIYITISANHGKKAVQIIESIKSKEIEDVIINLGHFNHNKTSNIISQVDAIILPSLLESFSLSCVEAWYYRKPLFISNLASMQSSCHNAASYFNPSSAADILNCLEGVFSNPEKLSKIIYEGEKRLTELTKWPEYIDLLKDY